MAEFERREPHIHVYAKPTTKGDDTFIDLIVDEWGVINLTEEALNDLLLDGGWRKVQ